MVVFYEFDELTSLLSLAYCLTIHKTQGMEYENALIPMTFSHYIMHNTKLLYTAITRAKKRCVLLLGGKRMLLKVLAKELKLQRENR